MIVVYYGPPLIVDALGRTHGVQPDGNVLVPPHHWLPVRRKADGLVMVFMGGMN